MDEKDIETLRTGNVDSIKSALPELSSEDLTELLAREVADANPRKGVIEAVETEQAARDPEGDSPLAAKPAKRETSKPADKPAWQKPNYAGPLDGEQAAWRRLHLKG